MNVAPLILGGYAISGPLKRQGCLMEMLQSRAFKAKPDGTPTEAFILKFAGSTRLDDNVTI